MKKTFLVLVMSLVLLIVPFFTTFGLSSASAQNASATHTFNYGQYTYVNNAYYVGLAGVYTGRITMTTYITVNEKGVAINKVTQSSQATWPLLIKDQGTSIIRKSSTKSTETAMSYSKFRASLFIPKVGNVNHKDYELNTSFKVTKIDKKKKKVAYVVTHSDNNGW